MAENNRVLNYSEFAGKYQKDTQQDIAASYSEFSKASDNFQEGFDEDTYEDGQSGPKRPIASGEESTPAAPDSMPTQTQGMEAPSEEEEVESIEHEDEESHEEEEMEHEDEAEFDEEEFEGGDPEAEEGEEDEEEDEDEDDEEEEDETNESLNIKRSNFILESFDEFEARGPIQSQPHSSEYDDISNMIELDFEDNYDDTEDNGECFVTCKSCGSKKEIERGTYPMGAENEANPDSWWQGAAMGMQCGCNM